MDYGIGRIAVIGGGAMGGGIAALCARRGLELREKGILPAGLQILVKEATEELCIKAADGIVGRFQKWRILGKISDKQHAALHACVRVEAHGDAVAEFDPDLVIEAIVERQDAKLALFTELDGILPAEVIFASNTSTIPITELSRATSRADRFIGTHFFNPPTTMKLLELIPGERTSSETVERVTAFARDVLDKVVIRVKDQPGFLVNCLLMPYLAEAVLVLQEYDGFTFAELDKAATDIGWPMGPFKLLDTVGIDVAYCAGSIIAAHRPELVLPWLFEFMVGDRRLGDKSGSGFYKTAPGQKPLDEVLRERFPDRKPIVSVEATYLTRILVSFLRESVLALQHGVATAEDIETGAVLGLGCPGGGPLHLIDAWGVRGTQTLLYILTNYGDLGPRFSVPELLVEKAHSGETFFAVW